jgi:hypothetical protein
MTIEVLQRRTEPGESRIAFALCDNGHHKGLGRRGNGKPAPPGSASLTFRDVELMRLKEMRVVVPQEDIRPGAGIRAERLIEAFCWHGEASVITLAKNPETQMMSQVRQCWKSRIHADVVTTDIDGSWRGVVSIPEEYDSIIQSVKIPPMWKWQGPDGAVQDIMRDPEVIRKSVRSIDGRMVAVLVVDQGHVSCQLVHRSVASCGSRRRRR